MNQIIVHALRTGDVEILDNFPSGLLEPREREWVTYIRQYKATYGSLPSLSLLGGEFSDFVVIEPGPVNDLLYDQMVRRKKQLINSAIATLDPSNIEETRNELASLVEKLSLSPAQLITMNALDRKRYVSESGRHFIISDMLTDEVDGIRNGEMVTVIGPYGVGKSLVTEYSALRWLYDGMKVLIVSNDMRPIASAIRMDSFMLHRDIGAIKDERELEHINYVTSLIYKHLDGQIVIPNRPIKTTAQVASLVRQEKITMVLIDGSYKLSSPNVRNSGNPRDWENATAVSSELVNIAHENKIPVVIVSQTNRSGEVAFSRAIAEDSDMVFKVVDGETDVLMEGGKILEIVTDKNRRGPTPSVHITVDFSTFKVRDNTLL